MEFCEQFPTKIWATAVFSAIKIQNFLFTYLVANVWQMALCLENFWVGDERGQFFQMCWQILHGYWKVLQLHIRIFIFGYFIFQWVVKVIVNYTELYSWLLVLMNLLPDFISEVAVTRNFLAMSHKMRLIPEKNVLCPKVV